MMRIKLLVPRVDGLRSYTIGDEVEVSEAEALRMVAAGHGVVAADADRVGSRETTDKKRVPEVRAETLAPPGNSSTASPTKAEKGHKTPKPRPTKAR